MTAGSTSARVVGGLAALLLLALAFWAGRVTAPEADAPGDSPGPGTTGPGDPQGTSEPGLLATPSPSASNAPAPPAESAPGAPGAPTSPHGTAPSAVITGAPGENVLAATGTGPRTLTFTPSGGGWRIRGDYHCRAGESLRLEVRRDDAVVLTVTGTESARLDELVETGGQHLVSVLGNCTWALRISG